MSLRSENLRLAYRSLRAARVRSSLTMLGIVIGVVAVVLVVCIGQGIKKQISGDLARYGKGIFVVQPQQAPGATLMSLTGSSSNLLSQQDFRTIQKTDGVAVAASLSTASGSMTGDNSVRSPFIIATTPGFSDIVQQHMISGGFFESSDNGKAVVLGMSIAGKLFNDSSAVGQILTWRGQQFIVSGVFDDFKAPPLSLESNFNNAVFVPYDTADKLMGGSLGIYQVLGKAAYANKAPQTIHAVDSALLASHGGSRDESVVSAAAAGGASDRTIHLLAMLVGGAAAIALIVGGIGIMNVMLVSVTERMYEIGLRKAIGATNYQIMRQFVVEALLLSTWGAVIGVIVSCAAVGLLKVYTSMQPVLVWQVLVIAPLLAVIVGVFFGSMPALKAARKDPIEALRHD